MTKKFPYESISSVESYIGHQLKYHHPDNTITTFPKNRGVKLSSREIKYYSKDGDYEIVRRVYFPSKKLPEPEPGVKFVVSKIVANLYRGIRNDLIYPGTHPEYDESIIENGKLVGIKRFRLPDIMTIEGIDDRIML